MLLAGDDGLGLRGFGVERIVEIVVVAHGSRTRPGRPSAIRCSASATPRRLMPTRRPIASYVRPRFRSITINASLVAAFISGTGR
jgi:hypothetical protein